MLANAAPPTLDAFATSLIKHKARWVARKAGLRACDRDDIAQELTVRLLQQLDKYDPDQGHLNVFVTTILDRHAKNLLRDSYAMKRDQRQRSSLSDLVDDGDGGRDELGNTILESERLNHRGYCARVSHEQLQLSLDVTAVLATLPPHLREIAQRLQHDTPTAIARDLGVSRDEIAGALRQLRVHFAAAGLEWDK